MFPQKNLARKGLTAPRHAFILQCVPYLICMGTDCDNQIRIKADGQLQEIDKKYSGFIQVNNFCFSPSALLLDWYIDGIVQDCGNSSALAMEAAVLCWAINMIILNTRKRLRGEHWDKL